MWTNTLPDLCTKHESLNKWDQITFVHELLRGPPFVVNTNHVHNNIGFCSTISEEKIIHGFRSTHIQQPVVSAGNAYMCHMDYFFLVKLHM